MWKVSDNGKKINLTQGDSGEYRIRINNMPEGMDDFSLYFQAKDPETRKDMGEQLAINLNGTNLGIFKFTGDYTRQYTVPVGDNTKDYEFAVKLCSQVNQYERTLLRGTMTVEYQGAEGING